MTVDEVLIEVMPGETRVALLDRGRLGELLVARPDLEDVTGNVYLGRVERTLPGIQAAFVDIGLGRSGFLALAEARPPGPPAAGADRITDHVGEGDAVLVQALNDPANDKGAKLTTRITLPGRYLVLTPGQADIRLSRRLDAKGEGGRLAAVLAGLARDGEGFIVRTAAADTGAADLDRDVAYLRGCWAKVVEARGHARPPACLHWELDPLRRVLRDEAGPDLERVAIDDAAALARAKAFCAHLAPDIADRVELHSESGSLFETRDVEAQVDRALAPAVALAQGGTIVIDEVAALTAIDVNTGGRTGNGGPEETALGVNLEAAGEIARQVRLRNISGLLAIDFVPMRRRASGEEVLAALRAATADDRCPVHVAGFSRMGLVEMTRERRRGSLTQALFGPCAACSGTGRIKSPETLAFEVVRRLLREGRASPGTLLTVTAPPVVIEALRGPAAAALAEAERRNGGAVSLRADGTLADGRYDVAAGSSGEQDG